MLFVLILWSDSSRFLPTIDHLGSLAKTKLLNHAVKINRFSLLEQQIESFVLTAHNVVGDKPE
jgi:hypothetical protein